MALQSNIGGYIVFDCETGGLDNKTQNHAQQFPITEIALITLDYHTLQEVSRYSSLIKGELVDSVYKSYSPNLRYDQEALDITGITYDLLEKEGRNYREVANQLVEHFVKIGNNSRYRKPILVGHNVTFDISFVQQLFQLTNIDLSKYLSGYKDHKGVFHPHYLDTLSLSRVRWFDPSHKHNLGVVSEREKVELVDAHRTLNDVIATVEIFKRYCTFLRVQSEGVQQEVSTYRNTFEF